MDLETELEADIDPARNFHWYIKNDIKGLKNLLGATHSSEFMTKSLDQAIFKHQYDSVTLYTSEFHGTNKKVTMSEVDRGYIGQAWNIYTASFVHWFFWNSESEKFFLSNKQIFDDFKSRIAILIKEAIVKIMLSKKSKAMKSKDSKDRTDKNKWDNLNGRKHKPTEVEFQRVRKYVWRRLYAIDICKNFYEDMTKRKNGLEKKMEEFKRTIGVSEQNKPGLQ